ncbi:LysR family transcriptional regulator [Mycobacterium sp. OTB74]|uniref:LysR family transcriptional regulator n=1 Tax=Mycobacterium sp. OTB74 TaxID=1853452 RepID=UPI00247703EB|nr:LysR family transcriptional regulator [Mycobacterium sp. OTB74]MDH6243881.1 LysR family transcriptional activator of glutamate synthase operon [Mycobacterium sp. OTB74]
MRIVICVYVDELRWFVVLAETGHMTEAAAKLNVSQPTLSRALARLEHQVGAPLFDRLHRRLQLNGNGDIMLARSRRSLDEIRLASEEIQALRDPDSGTVRLAFVRSVASWFVPELLSRFRQQAPQVQFDLREGPGGEVTELLATGEVDLAITGPHLDAEQFHWHKLVRVRLCLAVPRDHRLARRRKVRLTDCADESFILAADPFGLRSATQNMWAAEGISPPIAFEVAWLPTVEGLVAAGLGVAIVPAPQPDRGDPAVAYIPLSNPRAEGSVGVAWARRRTVSPVAQRFADFARNAPH